MNNLTYLGENQQRSFFYPTTHNKDEPLCTTPHYTDRRFDKEQTVFGAPAKTRYGHEHLHYNYSDRLWQWDSDKAEQTSKIARESNAPARSCRWYEAYLSVYFDKPIEIEHIIAGVNSGNGYPYCVFGYRDEEN